jgi:phosphoglycerate dehydrogenase-like enzyme
MLVKAARLEAQKCCGRRPGRRLAQLLTFPNVVVSGHLACSTEDALSAIAQATIANLDAFAAAGRPAHPVSVERLA